MSLTIGSLFSGIGGLELGLEWAGLGPVAWQVEKDPFCRAVLAEHWPAVERHADVTTVRGLPHVDLVCGGFPCQDVSSAGRGAGLQGARSGLWWYFAAIVDAVRPRFVVVENVASGARRWLPTVRRHLHLLGYDSTAYALSAADVGAPHLRRRIFVVAYADGPLLREQPGRRSGSTRPGAPVSRDDGAPGRVADNDVRGRDQRTNGRARARSEGGRAASRRSEANRWAWSVEPVVGRVAYGVPARVDRLRALGNAVVPQCAEVIGRIVAEMAGVA